MKRNVNISVCLASYNGEKFIGQQIGSILSQLIEGDELIIVDDCSTDGTAAVIRGFNDERIRLTVNESNTGVNGSFEKAIASASNDIIFMADQDDLWPDGRVDVMLGYLYGEADVVAGNSFAIDAEGNPSDYPLGTLKMEDYKTTKQGINNIFLGKAYFYGCAMAFKRSFLETVLPFPPYLESHDLFIAMAALMKGTCALCEENVLFRRIHGSNASTAKRSLGKKIKSRFVFLKSYNLLKKRLKKQGGNEK